MRKLLFLIALLLEALYVPAQDDVIFTRYSHFEGLPTAFNNVDLTVDQTGFLWVYTELGYVRYDGYNFKMYPFSSFELWGKTIPTSFEARYGGFERFFTAMNLDLYVYNPLKNGFDRYDFNQYLTNKDEQIIPIDDTKNHCIWVTANRNLFRLNYFTGEIKRYQAPECGTHRYLIPGDQIIFNEWGDSVTVFDIKTEKFKTAYIEDAGNFGVQNAEYFFDNDHSKLVTQAILSVDRKEIFCFNGESPLKPKIIVGQSCLADSAGIIHVLALMDQYNVWISQGPRLLHIDFKTDKMDTLEIAPPGKIERVYQTTGILKDRDNELWVSYVNNGLVRVNTVTKQVTKYGSIPGNPNSLWSDDVACIAYHSSGALWAATNSYGLIKIEKKRNLFPSVSPIANEFLKHQERFQVFNTRMCFPLDGDHLLAGTLTNVSNINIRTGEADVVRYSDNTVVKELTQQHNWGCAAADKEGNIFIGTWDNWLFIFNSHAKTCKSFYALPGGPPIGEFPQAYRTMLVDSRNVLWAGSRYGLFRIKVNDLINNPAPHLEAVNAETNSDSGRWKITFALLEDSRKNVWVGSMSGIKVFSPEGKVTAYTHEQGKNSLSTYEVRCFAEDKEGNMWIGTTDGLNKLDIKTHTFSVYSTKDGLPDNVIYSIIIDQDGNLWLSSNIGLSKFNPYNKVVTNFTPSDGLQGYEFNTNAFCTMPGGELVFGGPTGMNVFKPEEIAVSSVPPKVVLSSFKVLGEDAALDSNVTRLTYKQDNLAFQFAAISYYNTAGNQFAYKLEGLDHDWVYSGNRAYVTYSHVPPGNYTFRLKAANSSGIWNEEGVSYKISVSPPWWATLWFRIAAVLAVGTGIYFLYRYQLTQALKLLAIRDRIAGDLHDEIGSTLSSISIYSQVAKKEVSSKAPEAAAMLENITDSTTGMMDAMNDIVWMINTKNDRFDNIVDRMNAFANELLEAKDCNVHLHIMPQLKNLHLDMSQRKNLYLIFKEAINNAAKYADCRNVWIDISMNGSHKIIMTIKDDGKGFDDSLESKGNGLLSMQKRAKELRGEFKFNSKVGEGTMVKLQFGL